MIALLLVTACFGQAVDAPAEGAEPTEVHGEVHAPEAGEAVHDAVQADVPEEGGRAGP